MGRDERVWGRSSLDGLGDPGVIASAQHMKLGERLWIYLLQARPEIGEEFPCDTLLGYRIEEVDDVEVDDAKAGEGEADGEAIALDLSELAYGASKYPSFFIPSALQRILHGSCRKPHGGLERGDALLRAEALLAENHAAVEIGNQKRPALLLLTGDQIYADDVALALAALLRQKAVKLTGSREVLPGIDLERIPLHGRKEVLQKRNSGFSSGEAENHLFSFGEFAAMYLYVFGNACAWQPASDWGAIRALGAPDEAEGVFRAQQPALLRFHATLGKVRKLLANIPTYMIFDDHDVTDDWNITLAWYDGVRASPLGRRIVANALAAYWAFQGWGNDPDNFDKELLWSIQQRLTDTTNDASIAERYDLHTWKHRGWGFSIPSLPPIIALDSRSQRQYDSENLPAQLMDRYALDGLRLQWARLVTDLQPPPDTWPLLVATTPVLGFAGIELAENTILWAVKEIARNYPLFAWVAGPIEKWLVHKLDVESWISNKAGYRALFEALQRMGRSGCVFLSGDVHYAFSAQGSFTANDRTLHCLQLTSSALCNMPDPRSGKLLEKLGSRLPRETRHGVWLTWRKDRRWSTVATLLRPNGSDKPIHAQCNIGLVEFAGGRPVRHCLLVDGGTLVYDLPPAGVAALASR